MKGILISILALMLSAGLMAQLSCYDIQYTDNPNGDSPYNGQSVTVQGIVTAINRGSSFYIGDAEGGPWSGLYVFHGNTSNLVELGDMVKLTGTVSEYFNLTELTSVTSSDVLSQNNTIPITPLSTADLPYNNNSSEQYEGVLVRFNDVQIKSTMDSYGQYKIADSSNVQAMVDDVLYVPQASQIVVGEWWSQIQGVVDYHSVAGYKILPRDASDMMKVDDVSNSIIRISTESNGVLDQINTLNVYTSKLKSEWGVREYEIKIRIDPNQVLYQGYDISGSLSLYSPIETVSAEGDIITLHYGGQDNLISETDDAVLIKLKFEPKSYGDIVIHLEEFRYDDVDITALTNGKLMVKITENKAHLSIGTDQSGKNIFDPSMNEKINIEYGTKTGFLARALIRIYDAQGRLVATPVHQNFTSSTGIERTSWNGRDSNMKLLPAGLYYCHAEVSNRETGKRYNTVQPIVIKSRLK
ncbi:MAG: hypothetical protein RBR69_03115 [Candidatus Cloacimonadaceae bacterium]|jgi:uncharacterized surface protein with fasciclin (FAS1) repeats|nr:hypothetical protein [Candidatus Cloacimonadota bacterium]MDY0127107.1 hypothetical protein [Candidatus Cloacimonadaceae bacterium]MCB5255337.1 hypothetical protein [Candidatus Cloacimonadota bacterium]MCK9178980.1 hypothetical protein [Candidatus Cloacimonadota bacterium]MCK9242798.1 hypothetical protein [Candidatus Cloacimonadota bacterium]